MNIRHLMIIALMLLSIVPMWSQRALSREATWEDAGITTDRQLAFITSDRQARLQYINKVYEKALKEFEKTSHDISGHEKCKEWFDQAKRESSRKIKNYSISRDIALLYKKRFTVEEITDLLKFFKSPLGKKFLQEQPNILAEAYGSVAIEPYMIFLAVLKEKGEKGLDEHITHNERVAADRNAAADMAKLGAALKRFTDERADLGCKIDSIPPEAVDYMIGPWYGWAGTHKRSEVIVSVDGDEAWGCSKIGVNPGGGDNHYLYGVRLSTGELLRFKTGECSGRAYPGPDDAFFLSSALVLGKNCGRGRLEGCHCECKIQRPEQETTVKKFHEKYGSKSSKN